MDRIARVAVALVWLYNGLWCKLLDGCPSHREIIVSGASPFGITPTPVRVAIGLAEVVLALWVLSGRKRVRAAWIQTLILAVMNGSGLLLAGDRIAEPGGLIVHNLAFLTLVWVVGSSALKKKG